MRLTNPLWYLAALAVALGGSMTGTAIAASAWDGVRSAEVSPAVKPVDAKGGALAVFTDQAQVDREIACTTQPADQSDTGSDVGPQAVPEAALDLSVDSGGTRWHLLAIDTSGPTGVTVQCAPTDGRPDNAGYGYAVVDGFDAANRGQRIGMLALGAGLLLAALIFWQRRRARSTGGES